MQLRIHLRPRGSRREEHFWHSFSEVELRHRSHRRLIIAPAGASPRKRRGARFFEPGPSPNWHDRRVYSFRAKRLLVTITSPCPGGRWPAGLVPMTSTTSFGPGIFTTSVVVVI